MSRNNKVVGLLDFFGVVDIPTIVFAKKNIPFHLTFLNKKIPKLVKALTNHKSMELYYQCDNNNLSFT